MLFTSNRIKDIKTSQVVSKLNGNARSTSRIEITIAKTDKFDEIIKAKNELVCCLLCPERYVLIIYSQDLERKKIREEVNRGKQRVQEKYLQQKKQTV